jgi:hypothetical protein
MCSTLKSTGSKIEARLLFVGHRNTANDETKRQRTMAHDADKIESEREAED